MPLNINKKIFLRPMFIIGIALISLNLLSNSISAQEGWLQKGLNIFKGIGAGSDKSKALTTVEIGMALKDALRVGSGNVVSQLGRVDGFNADKIIHIPLPEQLNTVKSVLSRVKMSGMLDDLELKLNRAAEEATPKAKELFWQAINEMTFDDIMAIYKGPEDSATQYFKSKMSLPLKTEMSPLIDNSLSNVGAIQAYDNVMGKYKSMPFAPDVKANMKDYVVEKGIEGIFYYIAKEEAAIRKDPAKRTTDLLKKVFGTE